jgi:hypothetical protein
VGEGRGVGGLLKIIKIDTLQFIDRLRRNAQIVIDQILGEAFAVDQYYPGFVAGDVLQGASRMNKQWINF